MGSWHKRARAGVAIFGLAIGTLVYFAMGERQVVAPPEPVKRMDPLATIESYAYRFDRMTGTAKDFEITADRTQLYEDGSVKQFGVVIVVPKGEGRTFTVRAQEAYAGSGQVELELTGDVQLEDSDGFVLLTETARYDREQAIARAPAAVTFSKGRMSGSGVGVIYDQTNNVLTIAEQARVATRDDAGAALMEFAAGAATLDRTEHRLTLTTAVHVIRGDQVIDTDHAVARLSDTDDVVTFTELRGNSRVEGGGSAIDAMSARDIDLDYTDDGARLEAVALDGSAAVAMRGQNGAGQQIVSESVDLTLAADGSSRMVLNGDAVITMAGQAGAQGRRLASEALELDVGADGALTRAVGRENVRLDLPAAAGAPVRSIRARTLDGTGQAGKGLTTAAFTGDVLFTETPASPRGAATRTARAQQLDAMLASDAVTSATFTGEVTFEEPGFKACAGRLAYQPGKGALALSGASGVGNPMVADGQLTVEAPTIEVTLEGRGMLAKGGVTTQIGAETRCRPSQSRTAADQGGTRLPGLLNQDAPATITAAALDYQGPSGKAVYSGRAVLMQGETTIHADTITLDQANGDLTATGNAISTMTLDGEVSIGRAHELRYVDKTRRLTYAAPPAGFVPPPAPAGGGVIATEPQLSGPQGDLRAGRIEIALGKDGGGAEQIEARTNVRLTQGTRSVTGGVTLTYDAEEGKYVVSGSGSVPVTIVDKQTCRESSGRSVTFYTSADSITIDGENRNRTQTSACAAPAR